MNSLVSICLDLMNRLLLKVHRFFTFGSRQKDSSKSDSENTEYLQGIRRILNSNKKFETFRKSYKYREILEHVSFTQGGQYLKILKARNANLSKLKQGALRNDAVGAPITFNYRNFGKVSPTTLRYLKVADDIQNLFGDTFKSVLEIGAGYGGQASILFENLEIEKYFVYDLPDAQALIYRYLQARAFQDKVEMLPIKQVRKKSYDLAISNYAFSELPLNIQREYCEKILSECKRGYLTMNSGYLNLTGRSDSKMTISEILKYIPDANVYSEKPQTGPDNYMIVWGNTEHFDFQKMSFKKL